MIMAKDIANHVGQLVDGVFRLSKTKKIAGNDGTVQTIALLEDSSGTITCFDWNSPQLSSEPSENNLFKCCFFISRNQTGPLAMLVRAAPYDGKDISPLNLLPHTSLPAPETAAGIQQIIDSCPIFPLQQFIMSVFAEIDLALAFFQVPASREHHHAYPGGLSLHSLETVHIAQNALWQSTEEEYWLTTTAALFHDIGKTRQFNADGNRTNMGFVMRHEQLTLELLAPSLKQLELDWHDGAVALRYLLTHRSDSAKRPLLPCALAIEYADRMGCAMATRNEAFHGKPSWQRFAKHTAKGPSTLFWRPHHQIDKQGQPRRQIN